MCNSRPATRARAAPRHGSSAGARLAAQAYVTPGDPWFAGDDLWAGVTDDVAGFIGFYGYYDGDTLEAERYYGGLPDSRDPAVLEAWEHADSVAQAANAPGPALLFHGDVDGLITVAQTERFEYALLLQRPLYETEPEEAANRFAEAVAGFKDFFAAGEVAPEVTVKLVDLPVGSQIVEHYLTKDSAKR